MANTANADRCEIVCGLAKIGENQVEMKKSGRYAIEVGVPKQDIPLKKKTTTRGELENLKGGKSYYNTLEKQKGYGKELSIKENDVTER